ncbi:hypothetical protein RJ55_07920 [Drechmeria coniospora]|nr:hypothetical protein RJ55_07920 [Drechmeria coniospora]
MEWPGCQLSLIYISITSACSSLAVRLWAGHADGSQQITAPESPATKASPAIPAASRQARLQHLTTQLLWRLQQSSPHHAPSSRELTIPRLPDDVAPFDSPVKCASLVPGLEESRGALYEIGVSDDGTLMGLTNDEMTESIFTLRIMAASLGCTVDVVRMVIVGDCEWVESVEAMDRETKKHHKHRVHHGTLWVAEALVTPNLGLRCSIRPRSEHSSPGDPTSHGIVFNGPETATVPSRRSATPQLRVTLTGPTTSGKSSLLGTLSTGTLDNGRGKSRLSLLKHRHELVSGVTSSIAQELIGYKDRTILNLSHRNIESWIDIHSRADGGRLVFVSDSGGHPRYRRTLLRGLMNWAPHWSIHCTAAEATEEVPVRTGAVSSAKDDLRFLTAGPDSVTAHLELSLKLQVPVAVIITKLDLASKIGLQKTLTKVLTTIKEAGRIPKIMHPDLKQHYQQGHVPPEDYEKVQAFVNDVSPASASGSFMLCSKVCH